MSSNKFDVQSALGSAGINVGGEIANTLINQAFAEHNRKRNYYWNEKAANSADQRQRAQYKDLYSPQAMMDQYAAAGLSPSMMMSGGQSAVGGTPQGSQGGISGPYPTASLINPLTAAQIENIKADTEGKKAQTKWTMQDLIKNAAETNNIKMQNQLMEIDKRIKECIAKVHEGSVEDMIKLKTAEAEKAYQESLQLAAETEEINLRNKYTEETWTQRIKQLAAEYQNTLADNARLWAAVDFTEQQTTNLIETVAIARYNAETERIKAGDQFEFMNKQVENWAVQNGINKDRLKHEKTKKWLEFAANLIGSTCNIAASAIK